MQSREKILLAVVAGLLIVVAGRYVYGSISGAFDNRLVQIKVLQEEVANKERTLELGNEAKDRLLDFERRSLPADRDLARSLYQNWLVQLVDRVKLASATVEPLRGAAGSDAYYKLPFTIRGQGTLDQAVRFMHEFYSVDHLHLLRDVSLNPIRDSRNLDLRFTVEALVLPGAEQRTELISAPSQRLAWDDLSSYTSAIVDRNLFAAYEPPPPPRRESTPRAAPPAPPAFDPSKFTVLSAVVEVGGQSEAWFIVRPTGEVLKLREGQALKVGPFEATVGRIEGSAVELEQGDGKRRLSIGQRLSGDASSAE